MKEQLKETLLKLLVNLKEKHYTKEEIDEALRTLSLKDTTLEQNIIDFINESTDKINSIPSKTSQLTNDSSFITSKDIKDFVTKDYVDEKISNIKVSTEGSSSSGSNKYLHKVKMSGLATLNSNFKTKYMLHLDVISEQETPYTQSYLVFRELINQVGLQNYYPATGYAIFSYESAENRWMAEVQDVRCLDNNIALQIRCYDEESVENLTGSITPYAGSFNIEYDRVIPL